MRSRWETLHSELTRSIRSEKSSCSFATLKLAHPSVLGRFPSGVDLIVHLDEGSGASLDEKDEVLAALVRGAALPGAGHLATAILILALWNGLSNVFTRLAGLFRDDVNDLAIEIAGRFTECVRRLDLDRCTRVAATLVLNTERVVRTARLRDLRFAATDVLLESDSEVLADPAAERVAVLVDVRAWLRRAVPNDAELVFSVVVGGRDCREVAESLGLTYANARQRLARALARIRQRVTKMAVTDSPVSPACSGR
jgi:hypothetical protein